MAGTDDTQPSFPTYAELTLTNGWAKALTPVATATAAANPEQSSAGRYQEAAVLGGGGMGKVLLAHDARIGRDVAVKVLHADRELAPDDRERFLREAQVQGQLEHPSIVPVYDIDRRADGTTFFTMRRVVGRTLGAILDDLRAGTSKYTRQQTIKNGIQYAIMGAMMLAAMAVSRLFGPLILVPTIIATWAIVIQAHPERGLRMGGLFAGLSAIGLPVLLEWAGAIPSSYVFPGDGFSVILQMTALPTWFVLSFLGIANLLIAVLPALFVARLRGTLSVMQEREIVRSWHVRRLGDDLMNAAA